jgi:excinuclease UvrABC nuclease subunit
VTFLIPSADLGQGNVRTFLLDEPESADKTRYRRFKTTTVDNDHYQPIQNYVTRGAWQLEN